MIDTQKYVRKPLYVDAVRITSSNFEEIATWCQGEILNDEGPKKYIKVRVHNPKNPRQTKAFVGDWLLYTERGYKVYTNKAFYDSFDEVAPSGYDSLVEEAFTEPQANGSALSSAEGKRILTEKEQRELSADEVRELVQSGEVVLAQDLVS